MSLCNSQAEAGLWFVVGGLWLACEGHKRYGLWPSTNNTKPQTTNYQRQTSYCKLESLNVSPCFISPVSKPFFNQNIRCADVPCVNDSGTA